MRVQELPDCPISGKISYASKRVPYPLRRFRKKGKAYHMEPYRCSHCPFWHLTSSRKKKNPLL